MFIGNGNDVANGVCWWPLSWAVAFASKTKEICPHLYFAHFIKINVKQVGEYDCFIVKKQGFNFCHKTDSRMFIIYFLNNNVKYINNVIYFLLCSQKKIFGIEALKPSVRKESYLSFPLHPSAKVTKVINFIC